MTSASFDALPLHDALLDSIQLDWEAKTCTMTLSVFLTRGVRASPHRLHFTGVTRLSVPHEEPWGASVFVNTATHRDGTYRIEIQSGDTIEITAGQFALDAL